MRLAVSVGATGAAARRATTAVPCDDACIGVGAAMTRRLRRPMQAAGPDSSFSP